MQILRSKLALLTLVMVALLTSFARATPISDAEASMNWAANVAGVSASSVVQNISTLADRDPSTCTTIPTQVRFRLGQIIHIKSLLFTAKEGEINNLLGATVFAGPNGASCGTLPSSVDGWTNNQYLLECNASDRIPEIHLKSPHKSAPLCGMSVQGNLALCTDGHTLISNQFTLVNSGTPSGDPDITSWENCLQYLEQQQKVVAVQMGENGVCNAYEGTTQSVTPVDSTDDTTPKTTVAYKACSYQAACFFGTKGCSSGNAEPGYKCVVRRDYSTGSASSTCHGYTGDGVLTADESTGDARCDDGNTLPDDGCTAYGDVEAGWECSGAPSTCTKKPTTTTTASTTTTTTTTPTTTMAPTTDAAPTTPMKATTATEPKKETTKASIAESGSSKEAAGSVDTVSSTTPQGGQAPKDNASSNESVTSTSVSSAQCAFTIASIFMTSSLAILTATLP